MELGGNAPFVVFEDADIDAAVSGAIIAKMRNMGEACTAANRFYVHDKVHDAFAKKLADKMGAMKIGNGLEEGVEVGSLVNAETRDKVVELVDDAREARRQGADRRQHPQRARLFLSADRAGRRAGGRALLPRGDFRAGRGDRALLRRGGCRRSAATPREYGLVAYVFTKDLKRGLAFSEKLDFGMVGLNRGLVSDPAAPFGGMKQSGIGREGAHYGIMEFLETQYISVEW